LRLISGKLDFNFKEILPCNFIWNSEVRSKLLIHINEYYERLKKAPKTTDINLDVKLIDESKLKDFEKLLEYEKVSVNYLGLEFKMG